MKYGPHGVRFLAPVWPWSRGHLYFLAKHNTVHLQETALVVEGYQMRFRMPLFEWPIRKLLSEWTTLTIPYSHIVRHVQERYLIAKAIYWLLGLCVSLWLATVALAIRAPSNQQSTALMLFLTVVVVVLLFGVIVHLILRPRHLLVFHDEDGKRHLLCFRFQSAKRRKEFVKQLQANCQVGEDTAED
jgi:hypothetical protein